MAVRIGGTARVGADPVDDDRFSAQEHHDVLWRPALRPARNQVEDVGTGDAWDEARPASGAPARMGRIAGVPTERAQLPFEQAAKIGEAKDEDAAAHHGFGPRGRTEDRRLHQRPRNGGLGRGPAEEVTLHSMDTFAGMLVCARVRLGISRKLSVTR